ncbi:conserved hypothetical protein [Carnobacterium maltaromaticum]|nr:conserved hypothetical protein [Carnobacterium maltaromaticum]
MILRLLLFYLKWMMRDSVHLRIAKVFLLLNKIKINLYTNKFLQAILELIN